MNRFICVVIGILLLSHTTLAQVPMLDSTTIKMPEAKTLNKCIGENNQITYTQFECAETFTKAQDGWIEQVNITFSTPDQSAIIIQGGLPYRMNGRSPDQINYLDPNQSGLDMLKGSMKDKSLLELFDQGIKALMMRQEILNSL